MSIHAKILPIIILLSSASLNAETGNGKSLYNSAKCFECHDLKDFKDGINGVKSFPSLYDKVENCAHNTNTGWFDEEIMSVSKYLNNTSYHYKVVPKAKK